MRWTRRPAKRYKKAFAELYPSDAAAVLAPLREPWTYDPPLDPLARFPRQAKQDVRTGASCWMPDRWSISTPADPKLCTSCRTAASPNQDICLMWRLRVQGKDHDGFGENWPIGYADLKPYDDQVGSLYQTDPIPDIGRTLISIRSGTGAAFALQYHTRYGLLDPDPASGERILPAELRPAVRVRSC